MQAVELRHIHRSCSYIHHVSFVAASIKARSKVIYVYNLSFIDFSSLRQSDDKSKLLVDDEIRACSVLLRAFLTTQLLGHEFIYTTIRIPGCWFLLIKRYLFFDSSITIPNIANRFILYEECLLPWSKKDRANTYEKTWTEASISAEVLLQSLFLTGNTYYILLYKQVRQPPAMTEQIKTCTEASTCKVSSQRTSRLVQVCQLSRASSSHYCWWETTIIRKQFKCELKCKER